MISWHATFYQRVYEIGPDVYAPLLATVIPIGGIIGGVGAGLVGDWLTQIGGRAWLTAGELTARRILRQGTCTHPGPRMTGVFCECCLRCNLSFTSALFLALLSLFQLRQLQLALQILLLSRVRSHTLPAPGFWCDMQGLHCWQPPSSP